MPKKQKRKVPALRIKSFVEAAEPVGGLITKFGGQPVWAEEPQWPIGRTRKEPMKFICQIELQPRIFGQTLGRMAYLFVDEGDETESTCFWDANCGDSAIVIQPGGTCFVETVLTKEGPTLQGYGSREYLPELEYAEEQEEPISITGTEDEDCKTEHLIEKMCGHKIGGTPCFFDAIEYPDDSSDWLLLLQIDEDVPFPINCGLGMCYAFVSKDHSRGAYICQTG
jgi:hypothetical protein